MIKKLFTAIALCGALVTAQTQAAPILTDIVFVVDESGSMGSAQQNLKNNIGLFASILQGTGQVDARFGLVGYGDSNYAPRMVSDFTNPATFQVAANTLTTNGPRYEPGYAATAFALNSIDGQTDLFSYRSNAVKNIIIITDEPNNPGDSSAYGTVGGSNVSAPLLDQLLTNNNALYNGILSGSNTNASYSSLILGHGGNIFNLNSFTSSNQSVVETFVTNFANTKLQETLTFCQLNPTDPACVTTAVSEPAPFALLALGLAGLVSVRRMAKTA